MAKLPLIYCPDDGTWPLNWPSELVDVKEYMKLRLENERLQREIKHWHESNTNMLRYNRRYREMLGMDQESI